MTQTKPVFEKKVVVGISHYGYRYQVYDIDTICHVYSTRSYPYKDVAFREHLTNALARLDDIINKKEDVYAELSGSRYKIKYTAGATCDIVVGGSLYRDTNLKKIDEDQLPLLRTEISDLLAGKTHVTSGMVIPLALLNQEVWKVDNAGHRVWGHGQGNSINVNKISFAGMSTGNVCSRCKAVLKSRPSGHFNTEACKIVDEENILLSAGFVKLGWTSNDIEASVLREYNSKTTSSGEIWVPAPVKSAYEQWRKLRTDKSPILTIDGSSKKSLGRSLRDWLGKISGTDTSIVGGCCAAKDCDKSPSMHYELTAGIVRHRVCEEHAEAIKAVLLQLGISDD